VYFQKAISLLEKLAYVNRLSAILILKNGIEHCLRKQPESPFMQSGFANFQMGRFTSK